MRSRCRGWVDVEEVIKLRAYCQSGPNFAPHRWPERLKVRGLLQAVPDNVPILL